MKISVKLLLLAVSAAFLVNTSNIKPMNNKTLLPRINQLGIIFPNATQQLENQRIKRIKRDELQTSINFLDEQIHYSKHDIIIRNKNKMDLLEFLDKQIQELEYMKSHMRQGSYAQGLNPPLYISDPELYMIELELKIMKTNNPINKINLLNLLKTFNQNALYRIQILNQQINIERQYWLYAKKYQQLQLQQQQTQQIQPEQLPILNNRSGNKRKRAHEENNEQEATKKRKIYDENHEKRKKIEEERLKYFDEELPKRKDGINSIYVASKDFLPHEGLFECTHCYILQKYNIPSLKKFRTKAHLKEHLAKSHGVALKGTKRKVDHSLMNRRSQKRGRFAYKKPLNSKEKANL